MTTMLPRRDFLKASAALPVGLAMTGAAASAEPDATAKRAGSLVPDADFPSIAGITYLNAALKHPFSVPVAKALTDYADANLRIANGGEIMNGKADAAVLAAYARLINADPFEVSFVPSTQAAENAILAALGFPAKVGNIVTDDLHYDGSIYLYHRYAQAGIDVRQVRQHGGAVSTDDIVKAIDHDTRLVAISLVSSTNGFQHDLPTICAAAHAKGALVYADIIQAAGATPIDVKASGVDLCAGSTHKWLMGDKGLGFVYIRRDLLESGRIRGVQHGWKQKLGGGDFLVFDDRTGLSPDQLYPYTVRPGAVGQFEVGTYAVGPMLAVQASLAYIDRLGVANIHAHSMPFAERLRGALPRLGFPCLTPQSSAPYISSFKVADQPATEAKLRRAGVQVKFEQNLMRVSTSVFSTMDDIDHIIVALS